MSRKACLGSGLDIRSRGPAASGRRALAVTVGKTARGAVRRLGRGNGTAIPGMVALAIDAGVLAGLACEIRRGAVIVTGTSGKGTTCRTPDGAAVLEIPLPGLYNPYNAVAAAAAATAGQLPAGALPAIAWMPPGFFRVGRVAIDGRDVHLALAKNPHAYTEVLRAVLGDGRPKHMLLALDDRAGDAEHGVSWIWDVDFESLGGLVPVAVLSGNRAPGLAVRLKYAGWAGAGAAGIAVEPDPVRGLRLALDLTPAGQPLWVVSTYQVLWQLRDWLRRQGLVSALWEI